ncbi:FAD-dependent monooxygenase [Fulvia fulva]|uniref:FAD-dependent monooxygenase n=1 Tax=Passalora fulva TaxID=5499 RepID=A0A9Q8L7Y5_PASFU|nr:FAD-dependent monooxygenase [Fulvia fulva]KAK4636269.1 FAD-dependent monooxygenase [Fulvia fulva]KAK4637246.1 FAD-dependent monooxygenase [Fulvia fulva]UJO12462.1 FAD-dependent monooxygenase [Fulvia fulva]WPV08739.1 FAD-dependent monooxygenase [Fulvia fulva]WPV24449.1 FAD-dependent monooxygenase [Fulvia fulva]
MGLNIIIVGSGLAGLAAAAYLRKQHTVTVLEKTHLDFNNNDYGISVVCNAYGLLQKLGIDDTELDMAVMTKIWQRSASNQGLFAADFDTRKMYGAPSVLTRRSHLQRELYRLATSADLEGKPARIVEGFKVREVRYDEGVVVAEDGRSFTGDLIIGADGINSIVRSAVLSEDAQGDREAPATTHDLLAYMAQIPVTALEGNQDMAFFADAINSAGLANWQAPGEEPGPVTQNKRRILSYHISPRELQLVGYCHEEEFAAQFDQQKASILKDIPASRAKDAFHDFAESLTSLYDHHNSGDGTVEVWRIRDVDPLPRWSQGKVLLIGDAPHAIVPHAGQGYNLAVEDAEALGYLLRNDDVQSAIEDFSTKA